MKRMLSLLCAAALALAFSPAAEAVDTSARAAVLMDGESGRILYAQNAEEPMLIASITKIMTALVAIERCPLDRVYTVTAEDMAEGSSMYLTAGERITLEELLYGLMLSSGNDAALAVAHCTAGSVETFVRWMNEKAAALGMEQTSFANPNGLDHEEHYSTARDMAVLTRAALQNETFARIVSTRSITMGTRTLVNHNKLLSTYPDCIGVKTGYTKAAGRTLVSAARRDGQTLIAVTLGDGNDWADHTALLDCGFSAYPRTAVITAGEQIGTVGVKLGMQETVPLLAAETVVYPIGEADQAAVSWDVPEQIAAPVAAGAIVGEAVVLVNGEEIGRTPLLCGQGTGIRMDRPA